MSWSCPKSGTESASNVSLASSPFVFSKLRNIFVAMGCGNVAYLLSSDVSNSSLISIYGLIGGCMSVCEKGTIQSNGSSCNGINCCKTTIPSDLDVFTTIIRSMRGASFERTEDCKYAFLVDQKWFEENLTSHFEVQQMSHVPVVLNWEINANLSSLIMGSKSSRSTCQFANRSSSLGNMSSTFTCSCDSGFEGNPYLVDGCQGISTGITGLLFLFIGGWWSYKVVKKRKNISARRSSSNEMVEVAVEKNIKLFNSKDLEKATDNFNVNRILVKEDKALFIKMGKLLQLKSPR
ncbi:wall-associated receptor kinase-like 10 [Quercus suber]|uniref:Wall-associated receptor kinase-like 10 n=1 Tax=Quercus suber TaxID=58331 RepID=A0AAW0KQ70_QUESU